VPWVSPRTDERITLEGGGVRCGHRSWGFVSLVSLLERGICLRVCARRYRGEDAEGVGSIALNLLMWRRAARQKTILPCASCCGDDKRNLRVNQSGEPWWGFNKIGILHLEPRGHRLLTQLFLLYVSEYYSTDFVSTEISDLSGTGLHLNGSSASSLGGILSGYRLIALLHSITAPLNSVKRSEWTHINLGRSSASRILHHTPIYRLLVYGVTSVSLRQSRQVLIGYLYLRGSLIRHSRVLFNFFPAQPSYQIYR